MFPTLIDLGTYDLPLLGQTTLALPTYGFLFALSVIVAWWWFMRRGRELELPEDRLFNLIFYTILAGIIGAKLLLILLGWREYLSHPRLLLGTLRSAGVLLGGVLFGALTFVYYARRSRLPVLQLVDAAAAPLALAQAIGRLGCFCAGCCWGVETHADHPLALIFTNPVARQQTGVPLNVPLIATQLVQLASDLLLALVLALLWRRRPQPPGTVAWLYILLYSLSRGIIEFWRGDLERGLFLGDRISTSQWFALGGVVLSIALLVRGRLAHRRADTP